MSTPPDHETIGELCAYHPLALPLMRAAGIELDDPARPIDLACHAKGLDPATIRDAVRSAEERLTAPWRGQPVAEVIDHIVRRYHRPLVRALSELVADLAPEPAPAWAYLRSTLDELRIDMEEHLTMEEHVLFPWLRAPAHPVTTPIRAMQLEHGDTIRLLASLMIPGEPPALAARVIAIESWLCEHLHLESNELIPRVLHAETARG